MSPGPSFGQDSSLPVTLNDVVNQGRRFSKWTLIKHLGPTKGPRSAVRKTFRLIERIDRCAPRLALLAWLAIVVTALLIVSLLADPTFWQPSASFAGAVSGLGKLADPTQVRELDGSATAAISAAKEGSRRICLVTPDIAGPNLNGGIGTAFASLALSLATAGHNVTLVSAIGPWVHPASAISNWTGWQRHFRTRGVTLTATDIHTPRYHYNAGVNVHRSYEAYLWLKDRDGSFDFIHFPEWGGTGYFSVLAKRQGLDFAHTELVVQTHSPTSWAIFGNEEWPEGERFIETDFLERESIRLANVLVTPSRYMVRWMHDSGWKVPETVYFLRNVNANNCTNQRKHKASTYQVSKSLKILEVHELVFFGRLENRKGVFLFLDMVKELVARVTTPTTSSSELRNGLPRVTLIGKEVPEQISKIRERIAQIEEFASGRLSIQLISTFGTRQAQAYLSEPGANRVAIIPSLMENVPLVVEETMAAGVALLASNVGGIPELLDPEIVDEVTFPPRTKALLAKVIDALQHGLVYARPRKLSVAPATAWDLWHRLPESYRGGSSDNYDGTAVNVPLYPMVSVIVTTFNGKSKYLTDAILSLAAQSYPADRFEVILVDDGSDDPDALREMAALQPLFEDRGWRQLHTSNQYLGAARNTAAAVAKGEFLMFMDDDNLAKIDELETFVKAHSMGEYKDVLVCLIDDFAGDSPPAHPENGFRWLPLANTAGAFLYNSMGDANMMFRASSFKAIGGFTTDRLMYEDWEILTRAGIQGLAVQVVPRPLFWKRNVKGSMSDNKEADFASTFRAFRPIIDILGWDVAVGLMMAKRKAHIGNKIRSGLDFRTVQGFKGLSYEYRVTPINGYHRNSSTISTDKVSGHSERNLTWSPFSYITMKENIDGDNLDEFRHSIYSFPVVGQYLMHPSIQDGSVYSVSKKWVSFTVGNALVTWDAALGNPDPQGDGVLLTIEVTGPGSGYPTTSFLLSTNHSKERGQFSLEVEVGTTVRFVVDPRRTMHYDSVWMDFSISIEEATSQTIRAGLLDVSKSVRRQRQQEQLASSMVDDVGTAGTVLTDRQRRARELIRMQMIVDARKNPGGDLTRKSIR